MSMTLNKSALPESRRLLVELMQGIHFGRIENLQVRGGNPVLAPFPRVVCEIKCGGANGPRPRQGAGDFQLKAQVCDLFRQLDEVGNGTIEALEIQNGLPFRLLVPRPRS
jgi:hypothetical protein